MITVAHCFQVSP